MSETIDKIINEIDAIEYLPISKDAKELARLKSAIADLDSRSYIEYVHQKLGTPDELRSLDILTEYSYVVFFPCEYPQMNRSKVLIGVHPRYGHHQISIKLIDGIPRNIIYEFSSYKYDYAVHGQNSYGAASPKPEAWFNKIDESTIKKIIDEIRLLGACIKNVQKTEPEPKIESKAEAEPKTESKAKAEPKTESKAETEPKTESKAETEPKTQFKAKPEPQSKLKTEQN